MTIRQHLNKLIAIAGLALLTACGASAQASEPVLRIGLTIDDSNPASGMASQQFIDDLSEFLGMQVIAIEDITYLVAIEAMRAGNLDIMMASAFNYIMARDVVDVDLLATIRMGGEGNFTAFITRDDNHDIQTLEDLRGRSFAFVDPASTSGAIFPKYHFVENYGVNPDLIMHSGEFFSTAIYSGSHNASIMGVYFGDFDGAAVAYMLISDLEASGAISPGSIRKVDRTAAFPDPTYIVRSALGEELIDQLQQFFLTYDNSDYFYHVWGSADLRFRQPDADEFNRIGSLVEALGIGQ